MVDDEYTIRKTLSTMHEYYSILSRKCQNIYLRNTLCLLFLVPICEDTTTMQHTTSSISGWFLVYRRIGVLCRGTIIDSTWNQKSDAQTQMKPVNSLPAFQHACLIHAVG